MEHATVIKIINGCNQNCLFCSDPKHVKELPDPDQEAIFAGLRKKKYDEVLLTGGEPTIHPNLLKIVSYARELGYKKIMIDTNGLMLHYSDFADNLIHAGANSFFISFLTDDPESYDEITKVNDSHKMVISAIRHLKKAGVEVVINTVIHKLSFQRLPQIMQQLTELKVDKTNLAFVNPSLECQKNNMHVKFTEVMPYLHKAIRKNTSIENFPLCIAKEYRKIMTDVSDSKTYHNPCKTKPELCNKCKEFEACDGVWKDYLDIYGTEELKPI